LHEPHTHQQTLTLTHNTTTNHRKSPQVTAMSDAEAKPKQKKIAEKKTKGTTKKTKKAKGEKKKKQKKDPNEPKRSLSAFMLFSKAYRAQVKTENPEATFGELGKLIGQRWKDAKAEEKKKFQAQAEKDKAKYLKDKASYENKKASGGKKKEESAEESGGDDESGEESDNE